jgi:hypothetical protein
VVPRDVIQVPQGDKALYLDETLGIEHLYVVATRGRWAALEDALAKAAASPHSPTAIEAPFGLRTRGVGGTRDTVTTSSDTPTLVHGIAGVLVEEVWFRHIDGTAAPSREFNGAAPDATTE